MTQCQICGGKLQATLVSEIYYNIDTSGNVEEAAHLGRNINLRIYCEHDCESEPGAEVCSDIAFKTITSSFNPVFNLPQ